MSNCSLHHTRGQGLHTDLAQEQSFTVCYSWTRPQCWPSSTMTAHLVLVYEVQVLCKIKLVHDDQGFARAQGNKGNEEGKQVVHGQEDDVCIRVIIQIIRYGWVPGRGQA